MKTRTLLGFVAAMAVAFAPAQDSQAKLQAALTWLDKAKAGFSQTMKADVPALESILRRYYNEPESLRASEEEIALAFIATIPDDSDLGTRGGALDKMKEFEALMGGATKASPTKTTSTAPPTRKRRIPGVSSKPIFSASRVSAPGGRSIGAVNLSIDGKRKTVVEVTVPAGKLDVYKRAQVVATRMQKLSASNRLWWTMLRPAEFKGQSVVTASSGANFVITADAAFAREWGMSPPQLARQLVAKIRSAMDSEKSETFGSRDLTPEDLRLAAVDLRQQGDAVFASNPKKAEELYNQAIGSDPTYSVSYLRLADLLLGRKDKSGAAAVLDKALEVPEMDAGVKAEIQRKRQELR